MTADEATIKETKTLISVARQGPVNFAVCLGVKPETDSLMLHRSRSPHALALEAKTKAGGTKVASGTAIAEGSVLSLACEDQPPPGVAKRTRLLLKSMKLSFKVRLVGVDGQVFEEDGEEEQQDTAHAATPASATSPAAEHAGAGVPDAAALKAKLTALVQAMPAILQAHPQAKAELLKQAHDAQTALGAADLQAAAAQIAALAATLDANGSAATPPTAPAAATAHAAGAGEAVTYAKSRLAWLATRKKVESDVEKLHAALIEAYGDEPVVPELDRRFREVTAPIMLNLDETLADTLDEATNATDPALRAQKVADARAAIARYQAFLAGDTVIRQLDENPLVPIAIANTLNATLASLSGAIR